MKRVYLLVLVMIGIVNIICNKYTVLAEEEYPNSYTIGDYCNYERRAYIKYRTYAFDTTLDTLEEILEDAYWLMRNNSYFGMPTGKALVIGEEGEAVSALIKENESEWIDRAYYGLAKDMPNKMDMTYMSPVDFAKLDWDSYDFSVYDFIILEDSSRDVELTYEQYSWLIELTATSRYIIADKDMVDEYFVWDSDYDRVSCSYNPADQILTVFADPFVKNNTADSKSKAMDIYDKQLKLNTLGSGSEDEYQFSYSDVREIRWIGNSSLPAYAFTPFENLTAFMFLPDSGINQVGSHTFENLKQLEYVELSNATSIGDYAMTGAGITKLSGENLISIGSHAFENCKDLVTISTSDSLTSIGEGAFKNSGIAELTIPQTVTTLRAQTFYDCTQLDCISISLPENGLTVYADTFENVADDCRIIWDFGEGDNNAYILIPFEKPSNKVNVGTLQDYSVMSMSSYTIKKGEKTVRQYTLTFDANGGECDVTTMSVKEGDLYSNLPVPTREGYEFINWIDTDGNIYKDGDKADIKKDVILIADWKKAEEQGTNPSEQKNDVELIENTNWNFSYEVGEVKKEEYRQRRLISNETLSMKPIYRMNKSTEGNIYLGGKPKKLKGTTFSVEDENNAGKLLEIITRKGNNNKILLITSNESYNNCKADENSINKTVINSGMSVDELCRALTVMHCKYFQYLLYIQNPYTDTIYDLDRYDKRSITYSFSVKDWQKDIGYPRNADVYPVNTTKFNEYYSYCNGMDVTLNELINKRFSFDTNTTVVDAMLAINEYLLAKAAFDKNPLNKSYASALIIYEDGQMYIRIKKDKKIKVTIDSNGFLRDSDNKKIENYVDYYGHETNSHRIFDLKWFLTDTPDSRNDDKSGERMHGVCASYSKFISAIMGKCGFEAFIVGGHDDNGKMSHSFNMVVLEGNTYYCDFTDTYNSVDDPCKFLFLKKSEMERKENHKKINYNKDENGTRIIITDDDLNYNLTLDACGGAMIIKRSGYNFKSNYYEMSVEKGIALKNAINNIEIGRYGFKFEGWYTAKKGGKKYKANKSIDKNMKIYAQWTKIEIRKIKIKSVSVNNKKIVIKYKKIKSKDKYSYLIEVSNNKKFKRKDVKQFESTSGKKEIKLNDKGTYYIRVRASMKDSFGKDVLGEWSTVKKVKVE